MPTIKNISGPYRFFFYSFDCNEPEHVHVQRENRVCKYWLKPLSLGGNDGFSARELSQIRAEVARNMERILELGMSTAANVEARIQSVSVTDDAISAHLVDGRTISVPLAWPWRLSEGSPEQRSRFEILGSGSGIHWPDVDEDISVEGMLHGIPARHPRR